MLTAIAVATGSLMLLSAGISAGENKENKGDGCVYFVVGMLLAAGQGVLVWAVNR